MTGIARLRHFIASFTHLADRAQRDEERIFAEGAPLLAGLVAHDDWLPGEFARSDRARYRQYLLHCDPFERFSVVSFVWGPGQGTPLHDHTVWGMVGMLRGVERCEQFAAGADGTLASAGAHLLAPGQVDLVSPRIGDIHRVSNAFEGDSVSIHVYGANIGALERHTFEAGGERRRFVSGYANARARSVERDAE